MQNQALRIITGGVKSTPITEMQIDTDNSPLYFEREKTPEFYMKNYGDCHVITTGTLITKKHRILKPKKVSCRKLMT